MFCWFVLNLQFGQSFQKRHPQFFLNISPEVPIKSWKLQKLRVSKWPTCRNSRSTTIRLRKRSQKPSRTSPKLSDGELLGENSSGQNLNLNGKFNGKYSAFCVRYSARMRDQLIIIVSRRLAAEEIVAADRRNVSIPWSDLSFAHAFLSAWERIHIKTECPAWTDLQVSRLSSNPQPARKPTFSCNPLSSLHNSMTFETTFPGLFPGRVSWMFYVILRLPRWWQPAIAHDTLLP